MLHVPHKADKRDSYMLTFYIIHRIPSNTYPAWVASRLDRLDLSSGDHFVKNKVTDNYENDRGWPFSHVRDRTQILSFFQSFLFQNPFYVEASLKFSSPGSGKWGTPYAKSRLGLERGSDRQCSLFGWTIFHKRAWGWTRMDGDGWKWNS